MIDHICTECGHKGVDRDLFYGATNGLELWCGGCAENKFATREKGETMKELEELERLANTATEGPWTDDEEIFWVNRGPADPEVQTGNRLIMPVRSHDCHDDCDCELIIANVNGQVAIGKNNAKFIAAASPDVILSLIRELKITRRALDSACSALDLEYGDEPGRAEKHIDRARCRLYPETEQP